MKYGIGTIDTWKTAAGEVRHRARVPDGRGGYRTVGSFDTRDEAESALRGMAGLRADGKLRFDHVPPTKNLPRPLVSWPSTGGVYFAQCGDRLKIGWSQNIKQRLRELRTGAPQGLRLLAVAEGGMHEERAFHRKLARWRQQGEWFELAPEVVAVIRELRGKPTC